MPQPSSPSFVRTDLDEVSTPTDSSIDLTPLKELAKLQKLHLTHGDFYAADLPVHLTDLTTEDATVSIRQSPLGCSCVTSLQKLRVCDGHLSGLHPSGLLARSAVEHLQIVKCSIEADEPDFCITLADDLPQPACLPTGTSALTLLSSLTVTFGSLLPIFAGLGYIPIDIGPLLALPLLQDLFVLCNVSLWLPDELGALQNLTCLTLSTPVRNDHLRGTRPMVLKDVEWGGMHALQCLKVHNWHLRCSSHIMALITCLKSLLRTAHHFLMPLVKGQPFRSCPF